MATYQITISGYADTDPAGAENSAYRVACMLTAMGFKKIHATIEDDSQGATE